MSCLRGEADVENDHREVEGVGKGEGAGEVLQDLGAEKVCCVGVVHQGPATKHTNDSSRRTLQQQKTNKTDKMNDILSLVHFHTKEHARTTLLLHNFQKKFSVTIDYSLTTGQPSMPYKYQTPAKNE